MLRTESPDTRRHGPSISEFQRTLVAAAFHNQSNPTQPVARPSPIWCDYKHFDFRACPTMENVVREAPYPITPNLIMI